MRRKGKPAKAKAKARRPVTRTPPKRGASGRGDLAKRLAESLKREQALGEILREKDRALTEALEQRTATAEILKVIAGTPTDPQPVFDTIVRNAGRVCDAVDTVLTLRTGDMSTIRAHWGPIGAAVGRRFPLTRGSAMGRAILDARPIHVEDPQTASDFPEGRELARRFGHRTTLAVPLLREGEALGALVIRRMEVRPFSDVQIALLQTFADQAVIAIENVRLFTGLQASNRDLSSALDQQTATSDILRVISQSQTDVQPVFDAIVASAVRLLGGHTGALTRVSGDQITLAAFTRTDAAGEASVRALFPQPLHSETPHTRAVRDRTQLNIADVQTDPRVPEAGHTTARARGYQSLAAVPLLRHDEAVGTISVTRREPGGFTDDEIALLKTFADQAVIAIENVRLFTELEGRNRDLTATSEILRVISSSPTDVQPVFDTIVRSAVALCDGLFSALYQFDGELMHFVAHHNYTPEAIEEVHRIFPMRPTRALGAGRAILEGALVHIPDVEVDREIQDQALPRAIGFRSGLFVPMQREGAPIGVIVVARADPGPFSDEQIALLKTFADQAVIAVENVRLFTELQEKNLALTEAHAQVTEALEQQTATAEILRVISQSPTDVQPVFDTIVKNAVRLSGALFSAVFQVDGELVHFVAHHNFTAAGLEAFGKSFPAPLTDPHTTGQAILHRRIVHVPDVFDDPFYAANALSIQRARTLGYRSLLTVPMFREGTPMGAIVVARAEPGPFGDNQIELLKTFADQAVIAIENVRLFTELQASNRDLTTALDQQTATSDILRVISQSQTDVQPVFDAIVGSAVRLLGAYTGTLARIAGDQIELAAFTSTDAAADVAVRASYPRPLQSESGHTQAIRDRAPVNIADYQGDPRLSEAEHALARVRDFRSLVAVPLLLHHEAVGAIAVTRHEAGGFTDDEIALLQTFADQAVIAIENVRLFTELEGRNRDLTATGEILRVISSSPTDVQPVFDTIVRSAVTLCDGLFGALFQFDGELLHLVAQHNFTPEALEAAHGEYPARPGRGHGSIRAILERAVVHIPDVEVDAEYQTLGVARVIGWRSGLFVPMLREGTPIGVIMVARSGAGLFSDNEIELLKTFADQAVIAVENVRLFTELQASNHDLTTALDQQTATSDILRVISQSQTDVQPVFDAILGSAVRLLGGLNGVLTRVSGDQIELAAFTRMDAAGDASLRAIFPQPLHSEAPHAQVVRDRAPLNIADTHTDFRVSQNVHVSARVRRNRSWVTVPLLRQGEAVGTIAVTRPAPGGFAVDEIALLQTFADQAVIAIENVRLFTELEGRNRDLTATSEILRVIASSPTDLQPVFDTIAERAMQLCDAAFGAVLMFEGNLIHLSALANVNPEGVDALRQAFPVAPSQGSVAGRVILTGEVVHIPDVLGDSEYQLIGPAQAAKYRCILGVPMLHRGRAIGTIHVTRPEPGTFSDEQVQLLKTFADQAVIAVENVRLFKELQARTGELTRSVEQLTALGEISQAVSSTLDVETVLETIVSRASQLAGADGCAIYEYDDASEAFHIRATHNLDPVLVRTLRASPLRRGEGAMGRAAETREPTQVADIAAPGAYQSHIRDTLLAAGYRALLSVPLLREGEIIGSLSLNRHAPGEFPPEAIEVLKTFATQSALAIQNARLFREIADKSAQLETASRHKSEFLANMSHELRTPLNAIIGFSEVLTERMFGELNEKQDEYLRDINASGQHLLSLINDILDLSKIEAGRMELEAADFDLPSAIDNALILVRERASRRGITLGHEVDDRLGQIHGDERKVKQVLLNLLSNALKFTPEGGRIDVRAGVNDGVAEIAVTDTGVGIAPEDQEAVFEEFRQVGAADKKVEGTGLGLALSRKFIELHGGRIRVKSALGAGSTFTFTLPLGRKA